ncbi:MAG TPA: 16S rRNA (guanine(527)-N(7))-methyltransferase RsmG [Actinobacteria bacterium]|nr:16S rRNA (guanine(527)-N(7))-methyltransferase RsmG [Actinomycetota bacterium]
MKGRLEILLREGAARLGIKITGDQRAALDLYREEMGRWSKKINLTSIKDGEMIIVKHFLDSLSCAEAFDFGKGARVVDIGSGAGFPGLPLKIVYPAIELTLLDSSNKKTEFLLNIIDRLGLEGVSAVCCRVEDYGINKSNRETFDVVLARAVAPLPVLMEYALPLLVRGGLFVAQKSKGLEKEIDAGKEAAKIVGGQVKEVRKVEVPFLDAERYLVLTEKKSVSSGTYPRRSGIPKKRPLGKACYI